MREDEKRKQALLILELDEQATWDEVEHSYQRLLRLYGSHSLASYGLLRQGDRHKLLDGIGRSYLRLKESWRSTR